MDYDLSRESRPTVIFPSHQTTGWPGLERVGASSRNPGWLAPHLSAKSITVRPGFPVGPTSAVSSQQTNYAGWSRSLRGGRVFVGDSIINRTAMSRTPSPPSPWHPSPTVDIRSNSRFQSDLTGPSRPSRSTILLDLSHLAAILFRCSLRREASHRRPNGNRIRIPSTVVRVHGESPSSLPTISDDRSPSFRRR